METGELTKAREPMSEEQLAAFLKGEIEDAVDYVDSVLSPARRSLYDAFHGAPYGDEQQGRSQVISRDVRDTVMAIMPSLMRIFFGPERIAEFSPRQPEDVPAAEQATDYVEYILRTDNPGFLVLYAALKDALIKADGFVKYWWENSEEVTQDDFTGLDAEMFALLEAETQAFGGELELLGVAPDGLYSARVRRKRNNGVVRVAAVPPEEILVDRDARSFAEAVFVAHRSMRTVSELVELGYDYDDVIEHAGAGFSTLETNEEARARKPEYLVRQASTVSDPSLKPVLYMECYPRVDYDQDGIAELRKVCCIGDNYEIVANEAIGCRPLANFCADPEPHSANGNAVAQLVQDLQRIKSVVMRLMIDSMGLSVVPRMGVVEGEVNIEDVLNSEVGGIIRMKRPGMVQPFELPFLGQAAFPVLEYLDAVKQDRTGISKAAMGLDADALQSTTKAAVAATIHAAHQHIELIARALAETGMKPLMRGILKLLTRHQDQARLIRLRNEWVPMNPAVWDADMDVDVNPGISSATVEERIAALEKIAARQEAILQQYGPMNPLVTVHQYRHTLSKILELQGFRDPGLFFQSVPPDWQPPPPAPDAGASDPQAQAAKLLAEAQAKQIEADVQMKAAELRLKEQEMRLRDDRERDKLDADIRMKSYELELKYQTQLDLTALKAELQMPRPESQPQPGPQPQAPPEGAM